MITSTRPSTYQKFSLFAQQIFSKLFIQPYSTEWKSLTYLATLITRNDTFTRNICFQKLWRKRA